MDEANTGPTSMAIEPEQLIISLENTVDSLTRELVALRQATANFSVDQFLIKLCSRMKRMYGWKTDYVKASKAANCQAVNMEMIKTWQNDGCVPPWAFDQIDRMTFHPRRSQKHGKLWTTEERKFLASLHLKNPFATNDRLAVACSEKFGRVITENAIKGTLHRLQRVAAVPRNLRNKGAQHGQHQTSSH